MKQRMKLWAVMMLLSVTPIGTLYAQWERFYLSGNVKDISSRMYISDATVEVMTTDSVVLAEKKSWSAENLAEEEVKFESYLRQNHIHVQRQ